MELNGIIFDLDGVLIHTDEFHYQAWKQLADRLRIPFDRQVNNRLRGVSRMASLEIILEGADRSFSNEEKLAMTEEKTPPTVSFWKPCPPGTCLARSWRPSPN